MKRALISAAVTAAAVTMSAAPAWASTATPDPVLAGQASYTVVPGDSFWSISQHFGVNMSDLADWNHLNLWGPLDAGWDLQIPPAGWHGPSQLYPASESSGYRSYSSYVSNSQDGDGGSGTPAPAYSAPTYGAASYTGAAPSGIWACIAQLESGGNPAENTGNGYYGMYQFTLASWQAAGGVGNPAAATAAEQTAIAQRVQQQQGWGAWPVTSRDCGA